MNKLIYLSFLGLFFAIISCEKQDPLKTIEAEYMDSVHYVNSVFYPLEEMVSPEPSYENTYGVAFEVEDFYGSQGDSSQMDNVSIDKKTGIITVNDPSKLNPDEAYQATVATYTISGKTIHENAWQLEIVPVSGELFYSSPENAYERYFEGLVLALDSADFGEDNLILSYEFTESIKGLEIDAETGNISKTGYMDVGEYEVSIKVTTEGGFAVVNNAASVNIYGAPVLEYQPNFFKIQSNYDIQATPSTLEFLEGAAFELVVQDGKTLNGLTIDENAVIQLPEEHNNAIDTYIINVKATIGEQEFIFEDAISIEIVEQISPEISYSETKVTLSPWTGYTFTPELYSLPRNSTVTITTSLPEGVVFDDQTGSITIPEEQNYSDAEYVININVNTPSHGDVVLSNLTTFVIESKAQVLLNDDMTESALKDDYITQQVVIDDNERSGASWNTNGTRDYCRAQANVWAPASGISIYKRWSYIAVSYTVENIKRATVSFGNAVNKDLRDTSAEAGGYREDFVSVNYSADYDKSEDIHSFSWSKDGTANIARVATDMDNGEFIASGLLEIPSENLVNNKVNVAWLAHKNMPEIPEDMHTGHTFGFSNIIITAYTKYDAVVE